MRPCHWHEDRDGSRYLIPGCHARIQDPDGDGCTCPSLAAQLATAKAEIDRLTRELFGAHTWHAHVTAAVDNHPDGRKIMKAAANSADADASARRTAGLPVPPCRTKSAP
jgi:hypothetical protein